VRLNDLLGVLDVVGRAGSSAELEVRDVAYDSRRVLDGALFVCVVGDRHDGHEHAATAVERGAVALVCERELPLPVAQVIVPDSRAAMAPLAARFFGDPTASLRVVGITGTNGKTTTAFLVRTILETAGVRCGLLGTVEQRIGGVAEPVERTTPEAIDLQRAFRRMVDAGDRACAMEVSSHALALRRADGVRFAAAAFTNLSQDHLDFHGTMDAYFAAKARLFDGRCPRAVNTDDPFGAQLPHELSFGLDRKADVHALDVRLSGEGTRFRLSTPIGVTDVRSPLVGAFNVANALAAAPISGRLERSRSPPHPNTTCSRPRPSARAASSTRRSASGVCA